MDYAENYSHIQQIMSQQKWFKRLGTVLLVVIAHSWDFDLRKRVSIAHFMITDDLSKGNIQVTYFLEHLVEHYNSKYRAWRQPLLRTLVTTSDNCAAQFRSRYHFAWMVDFAEESETITTILSIYLAEYHGKGPADSAAGGAKTKADEAAVYGTTIETAYDLYVFLNAHYKQVQTFIFYSTPYNRSSFIIHIPRAQVTETHHEALHEIHSREFHYFQKGTFPSFSRRDPAALSTVKENYCFGARYTGLQEPPKQIFQRKTFCPCASCISG